MDSLDQVKKLREEYERALDAAESRRVAYHDAVLDLYRSGTPLREIAKELGLSHQRVHQIVSGEPPRRRNLGRAAGGIGGLLILIAAAFGALRLAHAPPFVETVRVPEVLNVQEFDAVGQVVRVGLNARVVLRHRNVPPSRADRVYAVSSSPGDRISKGSTVILYVEEPIHWSCRTPTGPCPKVAFYKALS
jgi:hypothetical protein